MQVFFCVPPFTHEYGTTVLRRKDVPDSRRVWRVPVSAQPSLGVFTGGDMLHPPQWSSVYLEPSGHLVEGKPVFTPGGTDVLGEIARGGRNVILNWEREVSQLGTRAVLLLGPTPAGLAARDAEAADYLSGIVGPAVNLSVRTHLLRWTDSVIAEVLLGGEVPQPVEFYLPPWANVRVQRPRGPFPLNSLPAEPYARPRRALVLKGSL